MFRRHKPAPTLPRWAELCDVTTPSEARRVGAEFAAEAHLAHDLLRVRPWLPASLSAKDVPAAILETEWTGIVALLADPGPWVYARTLRDLQELSHLYVRLFRAAGEGSAALQGDSLCARLGVQATPALADLEAAFWDHAARRAQAAYLEWQKARAGR